MASCFNARSRLEESSTTTSSSGRLAQNEISQPALRPKRPVQVSTPKPTSRPATKKKTPDPPAPSADCGARDGQEKVGQVMLIDGVEHVTVGQLTAQSGHGGHWREPRPQTIAMSAALVARSWAGHATMRTDLSRNI
eukprot:2400559-Pyramimonas_sp.AAC.1